MEIVHIIISIDAERLAFLVATPMWEKIDTDMGKLVSELLIPYSFTQYSGK